MAKSIKVKVAPSTGDPVKEVVESSSLGQGRTPIDTDLDIRDRLYELVGKGNALNPEDKGAIYSNLRTLVGDVNAQKLMNHAFLFNARGDVQKLPTEDKINALYSIGSSDPYIKDVLARTKVLGYGPGPGYRTSFSHMAQQMAGRAPETTADQPVNPEIKKRVMVKISR